MKIIRSTVIVILTLCSLNTYSQEGVNSIYEIDNLMKNMINENSPGCVIGVIKNGEFIHKKAYGLANLDYEIPLTTSSVFRIASTSKQFTAACIFLLEQQNKISLDDDIRKYLNDFPFYGDTIKVRHLVYHTSGLRDYTGLMYLWGTDDDFQYSPNDLYQLISNQNELDFKPGTKFSYSNSGYFLLSKIVESVTKNSLDAFAQTNIFKPLNMTNTHFHDNHRKVVKNRAYGYSHNGNEYEISMSNNDIVGDGGIFTTLDDLRKWDDNFYKHKVGGMEFSQKMTSKGALDDGTEIPYAGGLFIRSYRGLQKINHTGWYAGFKSSFTQYPEEKLTIIILANSPDIMPPVLTNQIANITLKDKLAPAVPINKETLPEQSKPTINQNVTIEIIDALVGKYFSRELGVTYELFTENSKLYCRVGNRKLKQIEFNDQKQLMVDEYVTLLPNWGEKNQSVLSFTLSLGDSKNILFNKIDEH